MRRICDPRGATVILNAVVLTLIAVAVVPGNAVDQTGQTDDLKAEINSIRDEISAAETEDQKLSGGLVKALIAARIQVLKTTEALLKQKLVAIETGAPMNVELSVVHADLQRAEALEKEIFSKRLDIEAQKNDAAKYSGGLVLSMKHATIATGEQTLAMLEQQYLAAKYGLPPVPSVEKSAGGAMQASRPPEGRTAQENISDAESIIIPIVTNKRYSKYEYREQILFDIEWKAVGLAKAARSVKGVLLFCDLFGDTKLPIGVTLDEPLTPGGALRQEGLGFEYSKFKSEHNWVLSTDLSNMTLLFRVSNILYEDGGRKDF